MAIVVEWVNNKLESLSSISQIWTQRVQASKKYGFPIQNGVPTYPPEREWFSNERQRSYLDGYQLYTLPGLLGTIFSYLELENDHQTGVRQLTDIVKPAIRLTRDSSTIKKNIDFIEIRLPNIGRRPDYILNDGTQRVITNDLLALSEYSCVRGYKKTRQVRSESISGILELYPKSLDAQDPFATILIKAFNLPGLGNDMDALTAMAIWGK